MIDLKPLVRTSVVLALLGCHAVGAADWPRFRGPGGTGIGQADPNLPIRWSRTQNVAWTSEVPGWGWASPIVCGNKVFLSTVVSEQQAREPSKGLYLGQGVRDPSPGIHRWLVLCYDLDSGDELWRHEAHVGQPQVPRHPKSTYAAETPVTDGERLFVLFGDLGLFCYSLDGDLLWNRPIEAKKTFMDYGAAASPVVHDGQVFVVYDNLEASWIASFDTKTGDQRWRTVRDEKRSWATPLVWENDRRTEIVVPGLKRNRSYSLDGELLWEFDGQMSGLVIPSPFAAHGMVYVASGYVGDSHRPTFAIRPGGEGNIAAEGEFADSPMIEWYQPTASPYNTSQIVVGDHLYTLYDQGFLTCHHALTGQEIYGKQRFPQGASFTASPWAYNGKLFCLSEDGDTYVLSAGTEFEVFETNSLDELCIACPAIVDDKLLIRTASKLYCLTSTSTDSNLSAALDEATALVDQAVASGNVAGAVHLVVQDGEIIHSHSAGVRDVESGQPMQADSIVRIYSMTKPITSVAAMTLYEQGKFQLDDPVSKFISQFDQSTVWDVNQDQPVAPNRPITVRDVFRHTTGYAYGGDGNAELEQLYRDAGMKYRPPQGMLPPDMTIETAAENLASIPAHHHPGQRFTYGFSTDLLGRLIEVWSQMPVDRYLRQSVLDPLEMHDTAFRVSADQKNRFASCHTKNDGKLAIIDRASSSPFVDGFAFLSGGGGLTSTAEDYASFCQMLVDGGTRNGVQVLKPETVQLMFTDQLTDTPGDFRFGLGFAINDVEVGSGDNKRTVKQYSWGGYASTDFRIVPELKLSQVFIRQHVPSQHQLANLVFQVAYQGLGETGSETIAESTPQPTDLGSHGFVDSDGVKLHYVTAGEGPLLIMLHGFPDYWYTWREQMPALAEHFKVVAVDLRGYNWSDQPAGIENYALPKLLSDVGAVIDHFDQEKAVVVGHDWGGMIAWSFAMQHPERVDRLVVLNLPHPTGLTRELANNPKQQAASAYAREFQQPDAADKLTAEGLAFWVTDRQAKRKYVEAFGRSSFESMLNYYQANYPKQPYQQRDYPAVRCPVLLIHGLNDTALLADALNGNWKYVENELTLVTIPGASHFVQQDASESVTRHLLNWLTR